MLQNLAPRANRSGGKSFSLKREGGPATLPLSWGVCRLLCTDLEPARRMTEGGDTGPSGMYGTDQQTSRERTEASECASRLASWPSGVS